MHVRNVCKECLANGDTLILNDDLLCPECEYFHSLNLKKIDYESKSLSDMQKRIEEYNNAYDAKSEREDKNFNFIFGNYNRAKELEKQGQIDKALEVYLSILEYVPPGTDYYNRPCIILEKKKEYALAIEICDLAIKCVSEGRFGRNASDDEFIHRKNRLIRKMSK